MNETGRQTSAWPRGGDDAQLDHLLDALARGEKQALEALYERTAPSIYGLTLSILKNPVEAQDVVQETFLKVWTSAPSYRSQGKPLAYMFTIANHCALMRLRKRARDAQPPEDWEATAAQLPPAVTPEERMTLQAAMRHLSDEEREIVMLHAVSGYKHREIAEFLCLSLPAVLSKYHRALGKLRRRMKEDL